MLYKIEDLSLKQRVADTVKEAILSGSIKPGEKMQVIHYANRIELVPVKKVKSMRGFLKGIDTSVNREKDRV